MVQPVTSKRSASILAFPGRVVDRCLIRLVPALIGVVLLVSGCATTKLTEPGHVPSGPQTFLPGAQAQPARSLAMGSAVSKGWKVIEISDDQLLATRPLDAAVAQSALGIPVSRASVEVRTDFLEHPEGVEVFVRAKVRANKGSEKERTFDFTESYRAELQRSLDSLRQSWDQHRQLVTSATPPLPANIAVPDDRRAKDLTAAVQAWRNEATAEQSPSPHSPRTNASDTPSPAAAPSLSTSGEAASTKDRVAATTLSPVSTGSAAANARGNMLSLGRTAEPGVWAYYAEHYAKIRGCDISGPGAVLEKKQPEYEIHRVYCEDGRNILVRCNAGTCLGLE
jgi:hypothetical protein